jgi:hypothetical protein
MDKKLKKHAEEESSKPVVYGNPEYSADEDIYSKEKRVGLEEEDDQSVKGSAKKIVTGEDLDVPGAELDDTDEQIGEEDEENNYYSLGGDDHDDLEEDKGE